MYTMIRFGVFLSIFFTFQGIAQEVITDKKPVMLSMPSLLPIQEGDKSGYINIQGVVVIEPQFSSADYFVGDRAVVTIGIEMDGSLRYGIIDNQGNWVVKPELAMIASYAENLAVASPQINKYPVEYRFGYLDQRGVWAIKSQFDTATEFRDGLALVSKDTKYGFIDTKGDWVIKPTFPFARHFSEELAVASDGKKFGYIDRAGNWVIKPEFTAAEDFSDGLAYVSKASENVGKSADAKLSQQFGFIDQTGKFQIVLAKRLEAESDNYRFSEGMLPMQTENGHWGYIDKSGKWVIEPLYSAAGAFSEELAAVQDAKTKLYGFIDRFGRWIIKPQFCERYGIQFKNGFANVCIDNHDAYINNKGEVIWKSKKEIVYADE